MQRTIFLGHILSIFSTWIVVSESFVLAAQSESGVANCFASNLENSEPVSDDERSEETEDDLSVESFLKAKESFEPPADDRDFDGYSMRDAILEKWGECYDVDFQRVESFGFKNVYLNVMPFHLGRRPFRHDTELDYLCHLQAVVEILESYNQLDYVLYQIEETKKRPIAGRNPIVAVPLRLDLTKEQVDDILKIA